MLIWSLETSSRGHHTKIGPNFCRNSGRPKFQISRDILPSCEKPKNSLAFGSGELCLKPPVPESMDFWNTFFVVKQKWPEFPPKVWERDSIRNRNPHLASFNLILITPSRFRRSRLLFSDVSLGAVRGTSNFFKRQDRVPEVPRIPFGLFLVHKTEVGLTQNNQHFIKLTWGIKMYFPRLFLF